MVTFFCIPKPFLGRTGESQVRALSSWLALGGSEVIVFGDEVGAAEVCRMPGLRHVPELERNSFGTPLLSDVFRRAGEIASNKVLCYVNADILLFPEVADVARAAGTFADRFLVVGRRWNFDAPDVVFRGTDWPALIRGRGVLYDGFNLDYFLFPKPLFASIPPFAVGRPAWDNWMIYEARRLGVPVIDATAAVLAGHQNHDYTHTVEGREGGKAKLWIGPEAEENRRLAGKHYFGIEDATHVMTERLRIRRRTVPFHAVRRWREAADIYPGEAWFWRAVRSGVESILATQHRVRLWLLARGLDTFPNRAKRRV